MQTARRLVKDPGMAKTSKKQFANEMIKNAVAWRARMPKASKFSKYFNDNTKEGTQNTPEPKVHINEATLEVMDQAAKDFGYTEQEFVKAVEMYQYFGN